MATTYDPTRDPALSAALTAAGQNGSITTPPQQQFDSPAMEGSMQQLLSENLGTYVIIEFLIGTQTMTRKAGILYAVGTSVVTLYEEVSQTFVTCDIFSVKFITFYLPGRRPWTMNNPMFGQGGAWMAPNPQQGWTGMSTNPQQGWFGSSPGTDMSFGMGSGVMGQESSPFTCPGPSCPTQGSIGWG